MHRAVFAQGDLVQLLQVAQAVDIAEETLVSPFFGFSVCLNPSLL